MYLPVHQGPNTKAEHHQSDVNELHFEIQDERFFIDGFIDWALILISTSVIISYRNVLECAVE